MILKPSILYRALFNHFGQQDWWPFDTSYHQRNHSDPRFEIMVGAILTQNTAWANVEKALDNLKSETALNIESICHMDLATLQRLIQPSGFFNQKAQRVKTLASYIDTQYAADLHRFFENDLWTLRRELLSLNGIGPETADSMLLYAGEHPIFVIDAYTKRICRRLPLKTGGEEYNTMQRYFETEIKRGVPTDQLVTVYKELHALIVKFAKTYCKKNPECTNCPLKSHCIYSASLPQ
jgi:endonuclease-3 related protein